MALSLNTNIKLLYINNILNILCLIFSLVNNLKKYYNVLNILHEDF